MDRQISARLKWVKLYKEKKDAGYVCRHCGISRPTLRKWLARYEKQGLNEVSRRPHRSPNKKLNAQVEECILGLRVQRNLGARRIQTELIRLHNY